jgi:tetratricopeptide (TPR) repeat protein
MRQRPPDRQRDRDIFSIVLAVSSALLAVIVLVGHLYLASLGLTDIVSTLLLSLLTIVFTSVFAALLGRSSALNQNKKFIRSALRTTYGLREQLQFTEQTARQGIEKTRSRLVETPELLSEFWEDLVRHTIDNLLTLMRRADETIANWREFLPEEVSELKKLEDMKDRDIQELANAIHEVKGALSGLSSSPQLADTSALLARISQLESERNRLEATSVLAVPAQGEARKLLAMGAYEEAIEAYSALINAGSSGHGALIGRARARYLAGDKQGALQDLADAEVLAPADAAIARLLSQITQNKPLTPVASPIHVTYQAAVSRGNSALARGDGHSALHEFKQAKELGLFEVLSAQDEAMAHMLLRDASSARSLLENTLPQTTGPYVRPQAHALLAICCFMLREDASTWILQLRQSLKTLKDAGVPFDYRESPLIYFRLGLSRAEMLTGDIEGVFTMLSPVVPSASGTEALS